MNNKKLIALFGAATILTVGGLQAAQASKAPYNPSEKALEVINNGTKIPNPTLKPTNAKIYLDGKQLTINDRVLISSGYRTYLPLRSLAQALGKSVNWNQEHHIALLESNGTTFELPLFRNVAIKDGEKTLTIDEKNPNTVVAIYRNRTYLPVRFESECLGYNVTYFDTDKAACLEIHLTTPGKQAPTKPTNPKPAKPSTPKPSTKPNKPNENNNQSQGNGNNTGGSSDGWHWGSGTTNQDGIPNPNAPHVPRPSEP